MSAAPDRPNYIVVEGSDGTGKSTQVELLATHLRSLGKDVFEMHEPAGVPIADELRKIIKNKDLTRAPETNLLLFTAARHEIWNKAKAAMEQGAWVVSARNWLSTLVYQGYGEGLSHDTIRTVTRQFTDERYYTPDYTFILTLDDTTRRQRIEKRADSTAKTDTFESRNQSFQDTLLTAYDALAKLPEYHHIDAANDIDTIQSTIRTTVGL